MPERFDDALEKLTAAVLLELVGYGYSFYDYELINVIDNLVENHRSEILATDQDEFRVKLQAAVERINKLDVELLQRKISAWDLHVDSYIEDNDSVRSVLALLKISDYRSALDDYLAKISRIIDARGLGGGDLPFNLEEETAELGKLTYNFWLLYRDPVFEHKSAKEIYRLVIKAQDLLYAINDNDIERVKLLVKSGACLRFKGYLEENLLHYACRYKCSYAMMELLIDLGLDIHQFDCCFCTPLHTAFSQWLEVPAVDAARALLEHGADVNAAGEYSNGSVLVNALACKIDVESLELLLDYGADITVRDNFGRTVFEVASEHGNDESLKIALQRYESKRRLGNPH